MTYRLKLLMYELACIAACAISLVSIPIGFLSLAAVLVLGELALGAPHFTRLWILGSFLWCSMAPMAFYYLTLPSLPKTIPSGMEGKKDKELV